MQSYPGLYEHLNKAQKDILASFHVFDGARVVVQRPVSSNFQVSHSVFLGSKTASQYHFGTLFVGPEKNSEHTPVITGDIDSDGNLKTNLIVQFSKRLKAKLSTQSLGEQWSTVIEGDVKGNDYSANIKVIDPKLNGQSGMVMANYLQSLGQNLALGCELMIQRTQQQVQSVLSFGARYSGLLMKSDPEQKDNTYQATLQVNPLGIVQASYTQSISNNRLHLGAELEANVNTGESVFTLGYMCLMRAAILRGQLDSNKVVSVALEHRITPGLSLVLSGQVDHDKDNNTFGMGLVIGGDSEQQS